MKRPFEPRVIKGGLVTVPPSHPKAPDPRREWGPLDPEELKMLGDLLWLMRKSPNAGRFCNQFTQQMIAEVKRRDRDEDA